MKKHSVQQYARALYEVTRNHSEKEIVKVIDAFIKLVRREGKEKQLPRIADAYEVYEMKREGRLPLVVKTKHPLDAKIKRKLRERFGEKREITGMIDASQKGGVLVRDGDTIYDATIDAQLRQLREAMTRN